MGLGEAGEFGLGLGGGVAQFGEEMAIVVEGGVQMRMRVAGGAGEVEGDFQRPSHEKLGVGQAEEVVSPRWGLGRWGGGTQGGAPVGRFALG